MAYVQAKHHIPTERRPLSCAGPAPAGPPPTTALSAPPCWCDCGRLGPHPLSDTSETPGRLSDPDPCGGGAPPRSTPRGRFAGLLRGSAMSLSELGDFGARPRVSGLLPRPRLPGCVPVGARPRLRSAAAARPFTGSQASSLLSGSIASDSSTPVIHQHRATHLVQTSPDSPHSAGHLYHCTLLR